MSLESAVKNLIASGEVLLGVDFDGTIAPIVNHPKLAVPDPEAVELLRVLAGREGVEVVVVSGRALNDLSERLGEIPGAIFIGEHGNDVGKGTQKSDVLRSATELVDRLHKQIPAATVETKQLSVTFHTRNLRPEERHAAKSSIREWAAEREGISLLEGKEVFELTTAHRTKGDALLETAGSRGVIYIGDDTTDETVFDDLRSSDVGVKVGEGPTSAEYRVKDIPGVVAFLELIDISSQ